MDSPLLVPPSLRLGGTYFPVLLCAGCAGSGSAKKRRKEQAIFYYYNLRKKRAVQTVQQLVYSCQLMIPEPGGLSLSPVVRPSCSASSFCMGPSVSLYGQRVVQWSPLQIRQDTIFCPLSLFMGSSS